MICFDMIAEDSGYPGAFEVTKVLIRDTEYFDNLDNKDLPEAEREKATRTEPAIWATTFCNGRREETMIESYKTAEEALAVYNDIMDAIKRDAKLYQFRKEGDGLGKRDNGNREEDRQPGEGSPADRVPQII